MADVNRYIDPVSGNDGNSGTSAGAAWATTLPLDTAGNWPGAGDRMLVNVLNNGDISSSSDWRVRRDITFIPPDDSHGVIMGGGGAARIFNCTSSPAGLTIDLGSITLDGTNCTTEWASVRATITIKGDGCQFLNSPARGFKVDGSHTIAGLIAPNSTWTTRTISSFRGFVTNTVAASTAVVSGNIDLDNANVTVNVTTAQSGYAAFTVIGSTADAKTFTADNITATIDIASGTGQQFGLFLADDYDSYSINNPTVTCEHNGNAAFAPRIVFLKATNRASTIVMNTPNITYISDTAPSGTGRAIVQIGDTSNAVDMLFTDVQIDGYSASGIATIQGYTPATGELSVTGIQFNRVKVVAKGDADVHRMSFTDLYRAVDFVDCENCRSYCHLAQRNADIGVMLRFSGDSNNIHANNTLIGEAGFEAGFMQTADSLTPVKDSEFANNLCFIKAGTDYTTGSHYICSQGTIAANSQIESARTVGQWKHNLYFQANKFDLAGPGDTAPVGSPLPFDFDVYDAGVGNADWKLNNTIYEWILNFSVDKTTPVWDSGHFTFNELTIDPQFSNEDGPYIPRNPAIQAAGYKWWETGETIYDLNDEAFTDNPPIGAYSFTGIYPLPLGGGGVSDIISNKIITR